MNQQPDKLFRDKLQNYQRTVPTSAWDRIAPSQDKKKPNRGWLKFAASLLLIAGAAAMWLFIQPTTSVSTLAKKSTESGPTQPEAKQVPSNDAGKTDIAIANSSSRQPKTKTGAASGTETTSSKSTSTPKGESQYTPLTPKPALSNQPSVESNSNGIAMRNTAEGSNEPYATNSIFSEGSQKESLETTANVHAVAGVTSVAAAQSVTLSYTTADVSAYLDKNIGDEATDDDKKQSTLKKLLQKANDLKTNQDPFGELRQRKNEILALNFKNDKRGQKTRN